MPSNLQNGPSANQDCACVSSIPHAHAVSTNCLTPCEASAASPPTRAQPAWAPLASVYVLVSKRLTMIIKSCPAYSVLLG